MKILEIIGYSYEWIPKQHEETNFDKELSAKQNKQMEKYLEENLKSLGN